MAMSQFSQIAEQERVASLRPIAILALEPDDLAQRYGLRFRARKRDGTTAALLETGRGHQYMLLRHFDSPSPGTEVLASELSTDPDRDLGELLRALDLDPGIVTWRLDAAQAHASRGERELRNRNGRKESCRARLDRNLKRWDDPADVEPLQPTQGVVMDIKLMAVEAIIYLDVPAGADPEDVAREMHLGLRRALEGFPAAEVVKAEVKLIREVPAAEADEEGLTE